MKAITVIEDDDGTLTVVGNVVSVGTSEAVELLHRGINSLCNLRVQQFDQEGK